MSEISDLAAAVTALLSTYSLTRDQLAEIAGGAADGGPSGNGFFPWTMPDGTEVKVPSIAKLTALSAGARGMVKQSWAELDAAKAASEIGTVAQVDSADAGEHAEPGVEDDVPNAGYYELVQVGADPKYWKRTGNLITADIGTLLADAVAAKDGAEAAYTATGDALAAIVEASPSKNLFDPAAAHNAKLFQYSTGSEVDSPNGITGKIILPDDEDTFTISVPDTLPGIFIRLYFWNAAGAYLGMSAAPTGSSGVPVLPGVTLIARNNTGSESARWITFTRPAGVKSVGFRLRNPESAHTTDDFNTYRNSIQLERGPAPTAFEPFGSPPARAVVADAIPSTFALAAPGVIVEWRGDNLYLRTSFDATADLVMLAPVPGSAPGTNNAFNVQAAVQSPPTVVDLLGAFNVGSSVAFHSDDTPPLKFNRNYIDGDHGAAVAVPITVTGHGKAAADRFSKWKDIANHNWLLLAIIDANTLWMMSENQATYPAWSFLTAVSGTTLTHVSGATNTGTMTIAAQASVQQVRPAVRAQPKSVLLEERIPLATGARAHGRSVTIVEQREVLNPASQWAYAAAHVGSTSDLTDASIAADVVRTLTTRINENGSWAIVGSTRFLNDVDLGVIGSPDDWGYFGEMQAGVLPTSAGETLWQLIPGVDPVSVAGTLRDFAAGANISGTFADVYFCKTADPAALAGLVPSGGAIGVWSDPADPPNRFMQYVKDAGGNILRGQALWYPRDRGPERSASTLNFAMKMSAIKKMYPAYYSKLGALPAANGYFETVALRSVFSGKANPGVPLFAWAPLGDAVYGWAHFNGAVDRVTLRMPPWCIGKRLTELSNTGVTVHGGDVVTAGGILVSASAGGDYEFKLASS
jgi:hypothetical protein